MNDPQLSQTAGRAKTRQPGLLVKPVHIVLSSYDVRNTSEKGGLAEIRVLVGQEQICPLSCRFDSARNVDYYSYKYPH
jgi:hypothetical protein